MQRLASPLLPPNFLSEWQLTEITLTAPQAAAGEFVLPESPRRDESGDPSLRVWVNGEQLVEGTYYDFDGDVTISWREDAPFELEADDQWRHEWLPRPPLAYMSHEVFVLTADQAAAAEVLLQTTPQVESMCVYYDGGAKATLGVDYEVADQALSWIAPAPWEVGNELQVWYVAA